MPRKIKPDHVTIKITLPYEDVTSLKIEAARERRTLGEIVSDALRSRTVVFNHEEKRK